MSTRVYRTASALVLASLMLGQPVWAQETVSEPSAAAQQTQVMSSAIDQTSQTSAAVTSSFNLEQIKLGNYASLAGTWQEASGTVIFITEEGYLFTHGANGGYMRLAGVKQTSPVLQLHLMSYPDQVIYGSLLVLPATANSKDQLSFSDGNIKYNKINDNLTYQGITIPRTGFIPPIQETALSQTQDTAPVSTTVGTSTGNQQQTGQDTENPSNTTIPAVTNNQQTSKQETENTTDTSQTAANSQTESQDPGTEKTTTDKGMSPSNTTSSGATGASSSQVSETTTIDQPVQTGQTAEKTGPTSASAPQPTSSDSSSGKTTETTTQNKPAQSSQTSKDEASTKQTKSVSKPAASSTKANSPQKKKSNLPKTGEEHGLLAWAGFFLLISSFSHWKKRD